MEFSIFNCGLYLWVLLVHEDVVINVVKVTQFTRIISQNINNFSMSHFCPYVFTGVCCSYIVQGKMFIRRVKGYVDFLFLNYQATCFLRACVSFLYVVFYVCLFILILFIIPYSKYTQWCASDS